MGVEFKKLEATEVNRLREALMGNAEGLNSLRMGKDSTFIGTDGADAIETERTITLIKSIPCHY